MASQANLEKMEMRQRYQNHWHTDLLNATASDPIFCCFSMWCGPCASYMLRKRALYNDMARYTCCGGFMPCSGHCGEKMCPEFCLCTEAFLCFANSVASTRFMIQDEFNIQTTKCDNCIIGFMFCLQQLACICSLIACLLGSDEIEEASQLLNCLSDMVYCSVCPCMQTQHKMELDKRDGKFGGEPVMTVPPAQQMSRLDHPFPPPVGYLPPPSYGYPPQSHGYPPQAHGYPTQSHGYPTPPQSHWYPAPQQFPGYPPPSQTEGYPTPLQNQGYPTPPQTSPQVQGTHPPSHSHEYPPPPQVQSYPPPGALPLQSPHSQTQSSVPASTLESPSPQVQGTHPPSPPHEYPPPPQVQSNPPPPGHMG